MRENLITAVCEAAEGLDYAFFEGNYPVVAGRMNSFPLLWLEPPELIASKGREERLDTYKVRVNMMMSPGSTEEERWRALEKDAAELCRALEEADGVRRVYDMKCRPAAKPITKHAEAAVEVGFNVELFCYM